MLIDVVLAAVPKLPPLPLQACNHLLAIGLHLSHLRGNIMRMGGAPQGRAQGKPTEKPKMPRLHPIKVLEPTVTEKRCSRCGEVKPADQFSRKRSVLSGLASECRVCGAKRRRPRKRKREHNPEQRRQARARAAARKGKAYKPREEWLAEKAAQKVATAQAKSTERERRKAERRAKKPWLAEGLSRAERHRIRYKVDEQFRFAVRMREAIRRRLPGGVVQAQVGHAIRKYGKSRKTERRLGYSLNQLRSHLLRTMPKRVTWEQFMSGRAHLGHIIPLAAFDLSDERQLRAAWALSNLWVINGAANCRRGAGPYGKRARHSEPFPLI